MKNNEYYKKIQADYRMRKKTKITELIALLSNIKEIIKDSNLTADQKISNIKDLFL